MKILFSGYRYAGIKALRYLLASGENVVGIITSDSSKDRIPQFEVPIETIAKLYGIPVFYSPTVEDIKKLKPDIHLCIFYNKIIDKEIIDNVPFNVNFHGGKLPDYKGCYPNIWAIINGEKEIEVTAHVMETDLDSGDIIDTRKVKISETDTGKSLYFKLSKAAVELLIDLLPKFKEGHIITRKQSKGGKFYKRKLPNDGIVDFDDTEKNIYNFIRALDFPPLEPAKMIIDNKIIYLRVKK
jgi:methionyl-tRNA formyltransferase